MPELTGIDERRAAYTAGLRALADALDAHSELMLPFTGASSAINIIPYGPDEQREQLAAWSRVLPGRKQKDGSDTLFNLNGAFGGLHIKVICDRDVVCERVVVATREVTEQIPDPDALAAVPTVTVTKTVEDVEWRCGSVLSTPTPVPPMPVLELVDDEPQQPAEPTAFDRLNPGRAYLRPEGIERAEQTAPGFAVPEVTA